MRTLIPLLCAVIVGNASGNQERWVSFTGEEGPSGTGVSLLWADLNGVGFEIDLPGLWVMDFDEESETYQRLRIPSCGRTADIGLPEMPYVGRFLAVPPGAEITAHVTFIDSVSLEGFSVWPAQEQPIDTGEAARTFQRDETFYRGDGIYPEERLLVSKRQVIRGCETVLLGLFPLVYQATEQTIKVYHRFRVEVAFSGGTGEFVDHRLRSRFFEPLFEGILLNHSALDGFDPLPASREDEADMIIIAPAGLSAVLEPLATWRTKSGLSTMVVDVANIGGNAAGIRQYLQDAYDQWANPPSFVLFVGDTDLVPTNYLYVHPYHGTMTGTDLWYVTVDGEDSFADIHHGRISVEGVSDAQDVMTKILNYEKQPLPGAWNNHVFLAAYEESGRYFTIVSDMVYDYLTSIGYDCDRAYEGGTPPGNTADVINNFNDGSFVVNHRDHGEENGWSHPSFKIQHFDQLNNGELLPVVYSLNCLSGYFDAETDEDGGTFESFSEEILRLSPGGALGVVAATRVSYSGYNDELVKGLYDAMWPGFDPGYPGGGSANPWGSPTYQQGVVLDFAKWWMYDKYVLTDGAGYPWGPDPTTTRVEMEMFHFHGDPSLDVHTAQPSVMVVTHDPATVVGVPSFTVYADKEGALVALSINGELMGRAYISGGSAGVVFSDPPLEPGVLDVVVTAHNRISHESEVQIAPASGMYVVIDSVVIDDFAGHVDGVVEQGDSLALSIDLWNVGGEPAPSVTGTLTSPDPAVTVVAGYSVFGNIPSDGYATGSDDFVVAVAGGVADGHISAFNLQITAGESLWVRSFNLLIHSPILSFSNISIDDTGGDGNGRLDPGETACFYVTITNDGSGAASSVTASLSSVDPNVTINSGTIPYPDVAGETSQQNSVPFEVSADSDCPEGTIVSFTEYVQAFGPFEEELTFSQVVGQPVALFVDSDDEPHETRLVDALNLSGYSYDTWYIPTDGPLSLSTVLLYQVVVWTGGDQNVSSMSNADRLTIGQYLDVGGALLFSAENYLTEYGSDAFTSTYLHIQDYTTSITANGVNGVSGDPITHGMSMNVGFPSGMSEYPDAIVPDASADAIFTVEGSGETTALRYPGTGGSVYRVVFMAIPFEALEPGSPDPNNPETFLRNALDWLLSGEDDTTAPEQITDLAASIGVVPQNLNLSWAVPYDNVGVHHYKVYRSESPFFMPEAHTLLAAPHSTSWTDADVCGIPGVGYYYVVTAIDWSDNESIPSNRVGKEDYLTPTGESAAIKDGSDPAHADPKD